MRSDHRHLGPNHRLWIYVLLRGTAERLRQSLEAVLLSSASLTAWQARREGAGSSASEGAAVIARTEEYVREELGGGRSGHD